MSLRSTLLIAAGLLATALTAGAHHSGNAFDMKRQVTLKGTVQEFKWVNPHTWLYVLVENEAGDMEVWPLEGASVSILGRNGWTSKTLRPGDKITVSLAPLKSGANGGEFRTVIKEDGTRHEWGRI